MIQYAIKRWIVAKGKYCNNFLFDTMESSNQMKCQALAMLNPSNWRIKNKSNYQSIDPIVPNSFRIKTNIDPKLSHRKLEDLQRRQMNQTYRAPKRYSSHDLELKIRSKIVSSQKFEPSSQFQQPVSSSKLRLRFHTGQNASQKKKYVFNFFHKCKQFSIRRQSLKANI